MVRGGVSCTKRARMLVAPGRSASRIPELSGFVGKVQVGPAS